ncbi:MAG: LamG domain-containing protein [Aquiluna sp.]
MITVAPEVPTIDKFTTVNVPASVVYVAAIAPDKAGDASLIVTVPLAAIQVAAVAPDRAGEDATKVLVPAAVVDVAAIAPQVDTQAPGINIPTAGAIVVAALAPEINPSTDPLFSSVSLLLPFDGANGSTTFTDSSSNALVPSSVVGSVAISTAQSKYGGASALFPSTGTNYIRYTPQALLQFTGDFTIELWLWQSEYEDRTIASSSSDTNTQVFRLNQGGAGNLSFYLNLVQVFSPTAAGLALNTWQHLAICRSGSNTRMFVDGVQKGSTETAWTGTFRMDVIGHFFFSGSAYGGQFKGHIDDLRVTKAARYTANFTPTGPHPLS